MYRQIQGVRLKIKIKNLQKKRKKGRPNTCSNMCMLTNFPHNLRALRAKSSIVHPILVPMGRETVSILMHLIAPNRGGGVLSVPFLSIPSIKLCCKCQVNQPKALHPSATVRMVVPYWEFVRRVITKISNCMENLGRLRLITFWPLGAVMLN